MRHPYDNRETLLGQKTSRLYHSRHHQSRHDIFRPGNPLSLWNKYRYVYLVSPRRHYHAPDTQCFIFPSRL